MTKIRFENLREGEHFSLGEIKYIKLQKRKNCVHNAVNYCGTLTIFEDFDIVTVIGYVH